jgi:hypothetical protein
MKHNPILRGAMSSMHGRKSGMDDREVLLLSTVLITDILFTTRSMHLSLFLCSLLVEISFKGEGL